MNEHPYQPVEDAFRDGKINEQSNETLSSFLIALSNEVVPNENVRHRDIIRGLTINHLLMQRHINSLNKQNSKIQKWVIALAIAALIAGAAQAIAAILPYVGIFPTPLTASIPPQQATPAVVSIQAKP